MTVRIDPPLPFSLSLSLVVTVAVLLWGCDFRASSRKPAEKLIVSESFEGPTLATDRWNDTSNGGWTISEGWLHSTGVRNRALWLRTPLPEHVRVEFDARSESEDGDLKAEIFGDGKTHASGYIVIFGGWHNSINTIARLDEHGKDRLEGARTRHVIKGRTYHVTLVRTGAGLQWSLDGTPMMTYDDPAPLRGVGHEHFAFNDWAVPVYFDNLRVYDLTDSGSQ